MRPPIRQIEVHVEPALHQLSRITPEIAPIIVVWFVKLVAVTRARDDNALSACRSASLRRRSIAWNSGQDFANRIRRLSAAGDKRHLDEVVIKIAGVKHWLWRAVDQTGRVLDVLVQRRIDRFTDPAAWWPRQGRAGA